MIFRHLKIYGILSVLAQALFWAPSVFAKHCPPETKRICLHNPLGEGVDIYTVMGRVIQGFLGITGTIALAIFIYAGIILLTSAGNPDKIKKGKDALLWTSIALVIIFGSYALVNFIITGLTRR